MPRSCSAVLLLLVLPLASCGVETAIIGASLSAGASAAETGIAYHGNSALSTFELVPFEEAVAASEVTAARLDLELFNERLTPGERLWRYYTYDPGKKLVITIRRRTQTVTSVHLRVSSPGERAMASLFVQHLARSIQARGHDLHDAAP